MAEGKTRAMNLGIVAQRLVRAEIVFLSLVYIYFVLFDNVPLAAFAGIVLIWVARASRAYRATRRLTRATPFDLPILFLVVWTLVSASVSAFPGLSQPKVYGVLLGAAFFYAIVNQIATRRDLASATFWLVLVSIAICIAGMIGTDWAQSKIVSASFIYDRLPRFIQGIPRSIAGGFARNGVGGTLTFIVPLLAAMVFADQAEGRKQKAERGVVHTAYRLLPALAVAALILSLVTLALTQSRGAILGTAIGLLGVLIWRERRIAWLIAIGAAIGIVLLALGQGSALADFLLWMDASGGTLVSRLEVWQRGVMMVQDFPLTGIGIGTFNNVAHTLYPFFTIAPEEIVVHAHNQFLQVAVDLGIPGLIGYTALLGAFAICAARAYRATRDAGIRALIAGLGCGMLAHHTFGLTDAFILGSKPGVLMWVYFALAAAAFARREEWLKADG
jgi:putative inorganic carbon (HCO3(-)) transporter